MSISYRLMVPEDYDQVYDLWLHCRGMALRGTDDSREGICRLLDRNPETCFVAEEDGLIVGVILSGQDGRRGYIYHTAVRDDCRRRGIGHELFRLVREAMAKLGLMKLGFLVIGTNETGRAFWEQEGAECRDDLAYYSYVLREQDSLNT